MKPDIPVHNAPGMDVGDCRYRLVGPANKRISEPFLSMNFKETRKKDNHEPASLSLRNANGIQLTKTSRKSSTRVVLKQESTAQ